MSAPRSPAPESAAPAATMTRDTNSSPVQQDVGAESVVATVVATGDGTPDADTARSPTTKPSSAPGSPVKENTDDNTAGSDKENAEPTSDQSAHVAKLGALISGLKAEAAGQGSSGSTSALVSKPPKESVENPAEETPEASLEASHSSVDGQRASASEDSEDDSRKRKQSESESESESDVEVEEPPKKAVKVRDVSDYDYGKKGPDFVAESRARGYQYLNEDPEYMSISRQELDIAEAREMRYLKTRREKTKCRTLQQKTPFVKKGKTFKQLQDEKEKQEQQHKAQVQAERPPQPDPWAFPNTTRATYEPPTFVRERVLPKNPTFGTANAFDWRPRRPWQIAPKDVAQWRGKSWTDPSDSSIRYLIIPVSQPTIPVPGGWINKEGFFASPFLNPHVTHIENYDKDMGIARKGDKNGRDVAFQEFKVEKLDPAIKTERMKNMKAQMQAEKKRAAKDERERKEKEKSAPKRKRGSSPTRASAERGEERRHNKRARRSGA